MTEDCSSCLDTKTLFNILCKISYTADTLGNNNDKVFFACFLSVDDSCDYISFDIVLNLRNEDSCSTCCDTCLESNITAASAHNFNYRTTVV